MGGVKSEFYALPVVVQIDHLVKAKMLVYVSEYVFCHSFQGSPFSATILSHPTQNFSTRFSSRLRA